VANAMRDAVALSARCLRATRLPISVSRSRPRVSSSPMSRCATGCRFTSPQWASGYFVSAARWPMVF
jgi:hypothetical protein